MHAGDDDAAPGSAAPGGAARAAGVPPLSEALHALGDEGRASLKAARDAAKALRILVSADISLARSAFGRTLAFTGVAIAFGASAWLLLMATLIVGLQAIGLSLLVSLLLAAALSIAVTGGAGFAATRYFEHTRMQATRRQLARLGIGELADEMPDPGDAESAASAAQRVSNQTDEAEAPPKKGLGIDVTPP